MTFDEVMTGTIARVLQPIIRRAVYPETTYSGYWSFPPGADILPRDLKKPDFVKKYGKKPLAARDRLSARLAILVALSVARAALMKEILADKESIADAKAHGYNLELGGNDEQPREARTPEADPGDDRRGPGSQG